MRQRFTCHDSYHQITVLLSTAVQQQFSSWLCSSRAPCTVRRCSAACSLASFFIYEDQSLSRGVFQWIIHHAQKISPWSLLQRLSLCSRLSIHGILLFPTLFSQDRFLVVVFVKTLLLSLVKSSSATFGCLLASFDSFIALFLLCKAFYLGGTSEISSHSHHKQLFCWLIASFSTR